MLAKAYPYHYSLYNNRKHCGKKGLAGPGKVRWDGAQLFPTSIFKIWLMAIGVTNKKIDLFSLTMTFVSGQTKDEPNFPII